MSLNLKAKVTLRHINVRKEGPDEDKQTAFDLKLGGRVSAQLIDELVCPGEESGRALQAFWDADGIKRHLLIEKISFHRKIQHTDVEIGGVVLRDCTLKSFSFLVIDDFQAELTWSVASTVFPSNALAILAECLNDELDVKITARQGDMFDGPAEIAKAIDALHAAGEGGES